MEFKKCTKEGFEIITPDRARKLLENNYEHNRNISNAHKSTIREDILNGAWNPIRSYWSDAFIISESGKLLNGQHRCAAIVESGRSVKVWVKYGAPEDLYDVLDDGKKRSAGDVIGGKNANCVAALSSFAVCIEDGRAPIGSSVQCLVKGGSGSDKVMPSKDAILKKYHDNEEFFERCIDKGIKVKQKLGFSPTYYGKVYYFISKFDGEEKAISFFDELLKDESHFQSINAYKNFVYSSVLNKKKTDKRWHFMSLMYAYFKYCDNEKIRNFCCYESVEKRLNILLAKIREEI